MTIKACFENSYGKYFEILIGGTVIRNGKSTFLKFNIRKCYYYYHKNFKIPFP